MINSYAQTDKLVEPVVIIQNTILNKPGNINNISHKNHSKCDEVETLLVRKISEKTSNHHIRENNRNISNVQESLKEDKGTHNR